MTPTSHSYDVIGHDAAKASFFHDYEQGRLPHGLLICGPKGIGKASLAFAFTRFLLSGGNPTLDPEHPIAKRIEARSHADLLVLEPAFDSKKDEFAREISVDQARTIGEFLSHTAGEGAWRVVIIDSVDQLNRNGANAILKILEEPPANSILMLISHNPGKLLPTIRSRCRMLKCAPLMRSEFERIMQSAAPELAERDIDALGELSYFSPGNALLMAQQEALMVYERLLSVFASKLAPNKQKLLELAEEASGSKRHQIWELLSELMLIFCTRSSKLRAGVALYPIISNELEILTHFGYTHDAHHWSNQWQESLTQFSLAESLHLDYKQVMINWAHRLTAA